MTRPSPFSRPAFAGLGAAMLVLAMGGPVWAQGADRYRDGGFTGEAIDTEWGLVQVRVQIRAGALVDVQYVQMPNHRRRSMEISLYALPALRSEAVRIQNARVHLVSGATITAEGFRASLATALAQAAGGGI